ncbi:hypothetical protein [Nocardioides sp. YIM 152315]|uniref:hypothetical protein n=1 Tax=Nocardioides sp. YIM 152315 TaxID=3031760 RepID=UPI0023DCE13C|nr:hypothetical protein [Nocardioides sp. YIM 152315]
MGLDLHQQPDAEPVGLADELDQGGNRRGATVLTQRQGRDLGLGELVDVLVALGQPAQSDVVHHHEATVAGLLDVGLDHVCSGTGGAAKPRDAVLHCLRRVATVPDDVRGGFRRQSSRVGRGQHLGSREETGRDDQRHRRRPGAPRAPVRRRDLDRIALRQADVGDEEEREEGRHGADDQEPRQVQQIQRDPGGGVGPDQRDRQQPDRGQQRQGEEADQHRRQHHRPDPVQRPPAGHPEAAAQRAHDRVVPAGDDGGKEQEAHHEVDDHAHRRDVEDSPRGGLEQLAADELGQRDVLGQHRGEPEFRDRQHDREVGDQQQTLPADRFGHRRPRTTQDTGECHRLALQREATDHGEQDHVSEDEHGGDRDDGDQHQQRQW